MSPEIIIRVLIFHFQDQTGSKVELVEISPKRVQNSMKQTKKQLRKLDMPLFFLDIT